MLIGYMCVIKADASQTLDLQRDALLAAGVNPFRLYEDSTSGKRDDQPGLEACLKCLRPGDILVSWKLDRLGRDLRHLINLVHELTRRGVGLRLLAGEGATIDTTTSNGKLMFGVFAALAEFERELIVERTRAGLATARVCGRHGGHPSKMTPAKPRCAQTAMGPARDRSRRAVRRAAYLPADALPPRRSSGLALAQRREAAPPPASRPGTEIADRCTKAGCR